MSQLSVIITLKKRRYSHINMIGLQANNYERLSRLRVNYNSKNTTNIHPTNNMTKQRGGGRTPESLLRPLTISF